MRAVNAVDCSCLIYLLLMFETLESDQDLPGSFEVRTRECGVLFRDEGPHQASLFSLDLLDVHDVLTFVVETLELEF